MEKAALTTRVRGSAGPSRTSRSPLGSPQRWGLRDKLSEAGLWAGKESHGHSPRSARQAERQAGPLLPLLAQPPTGSQTPPCPASREEPSRGNVQQQSYLKECENGRALKGSSRRRRNAVLGKGDQGPPQPLHQVLGGHAGTPMTTPSPHTTRKSRTCTLSPLPQLQVRDRHMTTPPRPHLGHRRGTVCL